MKLLVTGGLGFIGSNFIRYIFNNHIGYSVVNIDKLTYAGNPSNLCDFNQDSRYQFVQMDINDSNIEPFIRDCDIIVHFAAESHVDNSIESADEFVKTNVNGTYNLLKYALKYKKRFHHVSTDEVYGSLDTSSTEKFDEQRAYSPRNPYSATKAASDHLVRSYYETFGLPITVSNCSNNYGPYQNKEKFLPKAITNILTGKRVPVYGDGRNVRDWLYVEDHCRAIDAIIHKGRIGETYCIGGMEKDWSNLDILKNVAELMGKNIDDVVEFVPDRLGHDRKYAVSWDKINKELGWSPIGEVKDKLKETIEWYENNKWWWNK